MEQKKLKKGQAATEFLVIHSWILVLFMALVVALIVMGAVGQVRMTPQECVFGYPLKCELAAFERDPSNPNDLLIKIRFHNNQERSGMIAENLEIIEVKDIQAEGFDIDYANNPGNVQMDTVSVIPGKSGDVTIKVIDARPIVGDMVSVNLALRYKVKGQSYDYDGNAQEVESSPVITSGRINGVVN